MSIDRMSAEGVDAVSGRLLDLCLHSPDVTMREVSSVFKADGDHIVIYNVDQTLR